MTSQRACAACGRRIQFVEVATPKGPSKPVPVDAEPRVLIEGEGKDAGFVVGTLARVRGRFLDRGHEEAVISRMKSEGRGGQIFHVYVAHFATCTDPDRLRKR